MNVFHVDPLLAYDTYSVLDVFILIPRIASLAII